MFSYACKSQASIEISELTIENTTCIYQLVWQFNVLVGQCFYVVSETYYVSDNPSIGLHCISSVLANS